MKLRVLFYGGGGSLGHGQTTSWYPPGSPNLKNIDNVPLLVPLFTDCTTDTMCEMMKIMQENREVTCCLGSSANFRNSRLFLQSDLSISLDPLYPSQCSWETFGYALEVGSVGSGGFVSSEAVWAAQQFRCSVSFHRGESVSMVRLIEQARHTTYGIRKCFLFLLQCQLSLVIIQTQNYFLGCFLLKFGLSVCACLLAFGFTLQEVCHSSNVTLADNSTASCASIFTMSLLSQLVQATVDYQLWRDQSTPLDFKLQDIPLLAWLLMSVSLLLVMVVNEAVKMHEIRVRVRYQKRQKLQFETKLGMNSPF
ncbi:hypothetical protein WMY93_010816 [Mugilogobius chulae]|uniref:Transmembrane protein 94 n=1 Tax=Mugilogobius chulae TaxID=88201 RepID=A0AAW0PHB9_9GOBI